MSDASDPAVTADQPDSPVRVEGTDHITVTGSNIEDTVRFYRDLLGMPLVLRQPNLDQPDLTHLFFDTGDGRVLTFFVDESRPSRDSPLGREVGHVHHLAFRVATEELAAIKAALDEAGHAFSEFDRGAFHSVYTRDNNGLTIELVSDKWPVPDEHRGAVLARAHHHRIEAGAEFVDDEHMQAAVDDLGLDVEPKSVPQAPAGTGVDR
jgi:catechol 2,3-dioxygenase-like lactoylglutathione lyase family enzyme